MTDLNHNVRLCAYYYAAESFNRGGEGKIIDSFIPLVESIWRAYPDKHSFAFNDLRSRINEAFEVDMPSSTLTHLLSVMRSAGSIALDRNQKATRIKDDEAYWEKFVFCLSGLLDKEGDISKLRRSKRVGMWVYLRPFL